jgi:hypothetical protein
MFIMIHSPATAFRLRRRLTAIAVAVIAVAALLYVSADRVEAAAVCTGPGCDTVAFVNGQGRYSILEDLVDGTTVGSFYYGNPGDEPIVGDWDCDGEQTPAMYRRSEGFMYLRNSNSAGLADLKFYFGNPGDIPLAGDFNGDGCDTLSIYRPSAKRFYLTNTLGAGPADASFSIDASGTVPLVGDWNADGVDTIGLHLPSTGLVSLRNSNSAGPADTQFLFGDPGDKILAGDWNGDGRDTVGVYRKTTLYLRNSNSAGFADTSLRVGTFRYAVPASGVKGFGSGPPPPPQAEAARQPSGPISVSGESNVVIENLHVSNPGGDCVVVTNSSNVTIRNSTIGPCGGEAVYISDVDGAQVTGSLITDTGNGVLVHRSNSVKVDNNTFRHAGRNFVQFDKVNGAGSSISGNRGENALGGSNAEDFISVYMSGGTSGSPLRVVGNHLRNGGPSNSGSGIMLGDGGGGYVTVSDNALVNPGQVGIGVASGTNITVSNNRVYSDAVSWSNVGIYVWNQYGSACDNIQITGNQVNWTAAGGNANHWYNGGGCGNVTETGNTWGANIGPSIY